MATRSAGLRGQTFGTILLVLEPVFLLRKFVQEA